jgi:signal transduction histidine kinase
LARADSGVDTLHFQPVDLGAVAGSAVSEMQVFASLKRVRLQFSSSVTAVIAGDEEALRRVFTILLDNAVKATAPNGFVHVAVACADASAIRHAVVTVKDSGTGIPQEHLPHIFDRFYRANNDRSRETGGVGLGLAIARCIVGAHGGVIEAESEIGRGATFRVIVPVTRDTRMSLTNLSESASTLEA